MNVHRPYLPVLLTMMMALLPLLASAEDADPLQPFEEEALEDEPRELFGGPFQLEVQAGYTGTMWKPRALEPYQVNTYGRTMFYAELAVQHPLIIIGRAFDVIQIPRLRVETNFGYSASGGGFTDLIPESIRSNPYLRTSSWITFFKWFSFRYRQEKFSATLSDPRLWMTDQSQAFGPMNLSVENRMRDLEIGIIGSKDGEVHDTMIEVGYYRSVLQWPMVENRFNGDSYDYFLIQRDFTADGLYISLNTRPIKNIWPMHSQLMLRTGEVTGVDLRFNYEHELLSDWSVGLELDGSWRIFNAYETEVGDNIEITSNNPRDTRYKLTLYTVLVLL